MVSQRIVLVNKGQEKNSLCVCTCVRYMSVYMHICKRNCDHGKIQVFLGPLLPIVDNISHP